MFEDNLSVTYLKIIRTCPSNKSTGEAKALQHLAVKRDMSSKALDADTHRVSIKSSPVSYLASLCNHEIHETSGVFVSSMPYLTRSMSGISLTIDDVESLSNGMVFFLLPTFK